MTDTATGQQAAEVPGRRRRVGGVVLIALSRIYPGDPGGPALVEIAMPEG